MLDFGKHAFFIWLSYSVAIGALLLLTLTTWLRMRALEAAAEAMKRARLK